MKSETLLINSSTISDHTGTSLTILFRKYANNPCPAIVLEHNND
jgi:hypothetical protein